MKSVQKTVLNQLKDSDSIICKSKSYLIERISGSIRRNESWESIKKDSKKIQAQLVNELNIEFEESFLPDVIKFFEENVLNKEESKGEELTPLTQEILNKFNNTLEKLKINLKYDRPINEFNIGIITDYLMSKTNFLQYGAERDGWFNSGKGFNHRSNMPITDFGSLSDIELIRFILHSIIWETSTKYKEFCITSLSSYLTGEDLYTRLVNFLKEQEYYEGIKEWLI